MWLMLTSSGPFTQVKYHCKPCVVAAPSSPWSGSSASASRLRRSQYLLASFCVTTNNDGIIRNRPNVKQQSLQSLCKPCISFYFGLSVPKFDALLGQLADFLLPFIGGDNFDGALMDTPSRKRQPSRGSHAITLPRT